VYSTEFVDVIIATAGLFVMLWAAVGALLFCYAADEEAKGRQIDWFDEPLATPAAPTPVRKVELRKAACGQPLCKPEARRVRRASGHAARSIRSVLRGSWPGLPWGTAIRGVAGCAPRWHGLSAQEEYVFTSPDRHPHRIHTRLDTSLNTLHL
jgi:hypothetical protein